MMKIKLNRWRISVPIIVLVLVVVYILFSMWIAKDVRTILQVGMQPGSNYQKYMSEEAYNKINPLRRGLTNVPYTYDAGAQKVSKIRAIHFFFIARATANQSFQFRTSDDNYFGSTENVKLTLKLKHGRWVATLIDIAP